MIGSFPLASLALASLFHVEQLPPIDPPVEIITEGKSTRNTTAKKRQNPKTINPVLLRMMREEMLTEEQLDDIVEENEEIAVKVAEEIIKPLLNVETKHNPVDLSNLFYKYYMLEQQRQNDEIAQTLLLRQADIRRKTALALLLSA